MTSALRYTVLSTLGFNHRQWEPGATVEMDADTAALLVDDGVLAPLHGEQETEAAALPDGLGHLTGEQLLKLRDMTVDEIGALLFPVTPALDVALDAAVAALRGQAAERVEAFIARMLEDPEVNTLRDDRPAEIGELAPFVIDVARAAGPDAIREFLARIAEDPEVAAKLAAAPATPEPAAETPSFADVVAQLGEGDFGRDGKPKVTAIERVTGEDWNAARRDAAWAEHEAAKAGAQ